MREFELETWNLYQEERSIAASCWHCNEGWNKGKLLISPCKCTDQFIHIHCLEISANTENVIHCQFCSARYPLEIKQKSLLECYRDSTLLQLLREVRAPLYCIIFYVLVLDFHCHIHLLSLCDHIILIICGNTKSLSLCITSIYGVPFSTFITQCPTIREIYHQWIKSTQEFKLMEQYPNNIQVISV